MPSIGRVGTLTGDRPPPSPVNLYLRYSTTDPKNRAVYLDGKELENVTSVEFATPFNAVPNCVPRVKITFAALDVDIQLDEVEIEPPEASSTSEEGASDETQ